MVRNVSHHRKRPNEARQFPARRDVHGMANDVTYTMVAVSTDGLYGLLETVSISYKLYALCIYQSTVPPVTEGCAE